MAHNGGIANTNDGSGGAIKRSGSDLSQLSLKKPLLRVKTAASRKKRMPEDEHEEAEEADEDNDDGHFKFVPEDHPFHGPPMTTMNPLQVVGPFDQPSDAGDPTHNAIQTKAAFRSFALASNAPQATLAPRQYAEEFGGRATQPDASEDGQGINTTELEAARLADMPDAIKPRLLRMPAPLRQFWETKNKAYVQPTVQQLAARANAKRQG